MSIWFQFVCRFSVSHKVCHHFLFLNILSEARIPDSSPEKAGDSVIKPSLQLGLCFPSLAVQGQPLTTLHNRFCSWGKHPTTKSWKSQNPLSVCPQRTYCEVLNSQWQVQWGWAWSHVLSGCQVEQNGAKWIAKMETPAFASLPKAFTRLFAEMFGLTRLGLGSQRTCLQCLWSSGMLAAEGSLWHRRDERTPSWAAYVYVCVRKLTFRIKIYGSAKVSLCLK